MSGVQVSTNSVSTIPVTPINDRTIIQPNTLYTCPAGKKAKVKGRVTCTGLGAAAEARFSAAGVIMFRWGAAFTGQDFSLVDDTAVWFDDLSNLRNTPINVYRTFEFALAAGETIVTSQDSGTNSEFNTWMEVQEAPI